MKFQEFTRAEKVRDRWGLSLALMTIRLLEIVVSAASLLIKLRTIENARGVGSGLFNCTTGTYTLSLLFLRRFL